MQHERRHNPYPWTWELPAGGACAVLLVLALGVHLGNGLAHHTAGDGWTWPHNRALFDSIPNVLSSTEAVPGAGEWIISVELLLILGLGWAAVTAWQRWGADRLKGMATPEQAEQVLGVSRLRRVAHIIRPDLHTSRRATIRRLR